MICGEIADFACLIIKLLYSMGMGYSNHGRYRMRYSDRNHFVVSKLPSNILASVVDDINLKQK